MTPLTPEEQKMIDRILARGIAANDDSPQMGWRDYAAMAVVLFAPLCALFVAAGGLLFGRPGIIVAALFSLVFLAGTVVVGIAGIF